MMKTVMTVAPTPAIEEGMLQTLKTVRFFLYVLAGATIYWCVFSLIKL